MLPRVTPPHYSLLLLTVGVNLLTISSCLGQTNQSTVDRPSADSPAICDINAESATGVADRGDPQYATSISSVSSADKNLRILDLPVSAQDADGAPQCKNPEDAPKSSVPHNSAPASRPGNSSKPPAEAAPPAVSYANGELTVVAHDLPLSDVLDAIHARTGMSIEVPPGRATQRLYDTVGPAPLREALVKLLDGTPFNYVLVSSSKDPAMISKLILTAQGSPSDLPKSPGRPQPIEEASGPALYGGSGFSVDADVSPGVANAVASAPNGIPANVDVKKEAAASGMTPGQILGELQRKQIQELDQQYAQQPPQQ